MANDVVGFFSAEQACTLARISERQLRHWAASDFYAPEHLRGKGGAFSHIYSFRDIVSLRTIGVLRNKYNVPLPALRKAGQWLSQRHDTPWMNLRFRISGKGLYYIEPTTGQPVALTGPIGQIAHPHLIKLDSIASGVRRSVDAMKQRKTRDIGRVTKDRNVVANATVLSGTRIPTATIWRFHQAGYSVDQILTEFPRLKAKDVEAAIGFEDKRARKAG